MSILVSLLPASTMLVSFSAFLLIRVTNTTMSSVSADRSPQLYKQLDERRRTMEGQEGNEISTTSFSTKLGLPRHLISPGTFRLASPVKAGASSKMLDGHLGIMVCVVAYRLG
jgi:hypothetical protein